MGNSAKRCVNCKDCFPTGQMMKFPCGSVCSEKCKLDLIYKGYAKNRQAAEKQVTKILNRKAKAVKKKHAQQKRDFNNNDRPKRLKAAQAAFNVFIRKRDENLPCVSCGGNQTTVPYLRGGYWDCGHYLTIGAFPELRFEELNAHKQCKKCNGGSGRFAKKNHSVAKQYRINLIQRIGLDNVEWLEGPHDQVKLTAMDLKDIELHYKQKLKDLI